MNIFIHDRSNLDQIVYIIPVGHPRNTTDQAIQVTRREDLKTVAAVRRDIVLINGTRNRTQYVLEVTKYGFIGALWILDILSDEQFAEVNRIADAMRTNALNYEPAQKLIANWR